jgi:class 3 adenylate cyclase
MRAIPIASARVQLTAVRAWRAWRLGLATLMVGVVTETTRLIGGPMLASIVLGTYHRPVREQLIVMFLDLADSTSLAEKLGELRVHDLITRFFFDIDEPINDHGGSVLSYVGDEVIVTWPVTDDPARNARCLACFFAIDNKIASLSPEYKEKFETVPRFRAGLHSGPVIVSECGGFKRQLAYFGDTMNVSARLCEYCKVCGCNLIVSGDLLSRATIPQILQISVGQSVALRGRNSLLEAHEAHKLRTIKFGGRLCRNGQKGRMCGYVGWYRAARFFRRDECDGTQPRSQVRAASPAPLPDWRGYRVAIARDLRRVR